MAALPRQVLPVDQRARSTALQREPGVDKSGGAGVVVDKKRLGNNPLSQCPLGPRTCLHSPITAHVQEKTDFWVMILAPFSHSFNLWGALLLVLGNT